LLQICVGKNIFTEHAALRLLQIISFADASETKTNAVIISSSLFLRHYDKSYLHFTSLRTNKTLHKNNNSL